MQIMIDIDKDDFEEICIQARMVENTRTPFGRIAQAILHGTALPKGHDRLVEAHAAVKALFDHKTIDDVLTIIEADEVEE